MLIQGKWKRALIIFYASLKTYISIFYLFKAGEALSVLRPLTSEHFRSRLLSKRTICSLTQSAAVRTAAWLCQTGAEYSWWFFSRAVISACWLAAAWIPNKHACTHTRTHAHSNQPLINRRRAAAAGGLSVSWLHCFSSPPILPAASCVPPVWNGISCGDLHTCVIVLSIGPWESGWRQDGCARNPLPLDQLPAWRIKGVRFWIKICHITRKCYDGFEREF